MLSLYSSTQLLLYMATVVMNSDESAAQLTPKQLSQVNKELSSLQPVVDALRILNEQRQEVRHDIFTSTLSCTDSCNFACRHEEAQF